jgi:hypothetical protein
MRRVDVVTSVTFVVRVGRGPDGRLAGIVERVRTGEKHRFQEAGAIGRLIERMVDDEPRDAESRGS